MSTTNSGCGAPISLSCTLPAHHVGRCRHEVRSRPREELELANGCLDMIREDLEAYGVDMSATPPMMYNDALRSLVAKLGLKAGFTDTQEIAAYIRGHSVTLPQERTS